MRVPDVALSELEANASDAGVAKVDIIIPDKRGEVLSVGDDGDGWVDCFDALDCMWDPAC